jgi:hypothetical protein
MSVNQQPAGTQYNFSGLSTDPKPYFPAQPVQPGCIFTETDTLKQWIYQSNNTWQPYYASAVTYLWQPSTLSYITATADATGNLNTTGSGGGSGGTVTANQGTAGSYPWLVKESSAILGGYYLNTFENATPMYIGKSNISGNWLIQRYNQTDGTMRYANLSNNLGYSTYDSAWANRYSLTYAEIQSLTIT